MYETISKKSKAERRSPEEGRDVTCQTWLIIENFQKKPFSSERWGNYLVRKGRITITGAARHVVEGDFRAVSSRMCKEAGRPFG